MGGGFIYRWGSISDCPHQPGFPVMRSYSTLSLSSRVPNGVCEQERINLHYQTVRSTMVRVILCLFTIVSSVPFTELRTSYALNKYLWNEWMTKWINDWYKSKNMLSTSSGFTINFLLILDISFNLYGIHFSPWSKLKAKSLNFFPIQNLNVSYSHRFWFLFLFLFSYFPLSSACFSHCLLFVCSRTKPSTPGAAI